MAARTPAPVWFQTRPSRYLAVFLVTVHALAIIAVAQTPLPGWAALMASVALMANGVWCVIARAWQRGPVGVKALHWQTDGVWRVLAGDGQVYRYTTAQVGLAHPWLVLVDLTGPDASRTLVLAADSADPEALRRLRVRLRALRPAHELDQDRPLAGT